ncbi:glycosyltransferase family 9 protein [uncultured Psychrosphaera sp.]|uniref:glycosyltransferase family 9 protein n=1 Tax=uncultured Psychrosphaera sp. TaxID=1403522 RepID=UPI0026121145|nr:glycosyltransferase family 9 protein [uncultured Psychrosphaera sp.]
MTILSQFDLIFVVGVYVSLQSICVLRLSAIGDVCHAVAAVQAIQRKHPQAKITWIIGKIEKMLLDGLPNVEFVIFDKSKGRAAFKQLQHDLAGKEFDVLLHMQVALRANWAAKYINAKRKIGFDRDRSKELHALFTKERIASQVEPHVIEGFFGFAQKLGVSLAELDNLTWNIPVSNDDIKFANSHIDPKSKTFVISPAASKKERNWLPERYAALADHAAQKGFKVALCGGPAPIDRELGDAIIENAETEITDLIGKTSLKQMLVCLKNATLVLAPDTGPAHMAVTQGTPVLGVYAHSNPKRTGPYLYQKYVTEVYHRNLFLQKGDSAENLKWGVRVKGADLMQQITVEHVKEKFDNIVQDFEL